MTKMNLLDLVKKRKKERTEEEQQIPIMDEPEIEEISDPAENLIQQADAVLATTNTEPATEVIVEKVKKRKTETKNTKARKKRAKVNKNITERLMKLPVAERFKTVETAVKMVINSISKDPTVSAAGINGVIICGQGGTGKTYLTTETLIKAGLIDGKDWWKNSGKSSAFGLYQLLYEHKEGGIIVLDDSDIWTDKEAVNILKAALDTYGKRVVSWNTKGAEQAGLPKSFTTKAAVIFITNREEKDIPQPMRDRCIYIPLEVTREEMFERMHQILPNIEPKGKEHLEMKREVLDYLTSVRIDTDDEVSLRTLYQAIKWRQSSDTEIRMMKQQGTKVEPERYKQWKTWVNLLC